MTTERIDIVISERGSRVVKRNLEDIGKTSRGAADSVDFLRRALLGLGAAMGLHQIIQAVNAYDRLQNQLRVAGLATDQLAGATNRLLTIANSTRQSIEATGTLYGRLAGASQELGATQEQLYTFVQAVGSALAVNGTEAGTAAGVLLQLSQAMGGSVIQAQEFNSVIDGARPLLAAAAKHIDGAAGSVSRLKAMVNDGEITAEAFFKAVLKGAPDLEALLGKSVTTIDQALQVLSNNFTIYIGRLSETTGFSRAVSGAILTLATNLDTLGDAVMTLAKVLGIAAAAYLTMQAALKVGEISTAISSWLALRQAIAAGNVVMLGSAEASRQKAVAALVAAEADVAGTAATLAAAQGEEALMVAKVAEIRVTQQQLVAERALEVVRLKAQISDTGRAQSLARLAEVRTAELALTNALAGAEGRLAAAQTATAAAANGNAAAASRLAAANTTVAATSAAAAGSTSLLGQAVTALRNGIAALFAIVAAHPLVALLTVLATATTALFLFRDQINLGVDDITTLGDLMRAFGKVVGDAFGKIADAARELFGPLFALIQEWVGKIDVSVIGILRLVAKAVDSFVGFWKGAVNATVAYFRGFGPAIADLTTMALNAVLKKIGAFVNAAGELLSSLTEFAGLGKIAAVDLELPNGFEGQAAQLGRDVGNAFSEGFNSSTYATDFLNRLTTEAQKIAKARKDAEGKGGGGSEEPGKPTPAAGDPEKDKKVKRDLAEELRQLISSYDRVYAAQLQFSEGIGLINEAEAKGLITHQQGAAFIELMRKQLEDALDPMAALNRELDFEQELIGKTSEQRRIDTQLRQIQQDLLMQGVQLGEDELSQLRERLTLIDRMTDAEERRRDLLEEIKGPQEEMRKDMAALNQLFQAGSISLSEYLVKLSELKISLGEGSFADGFIANVEMMEASWANFATNSGSLFADLTNTFTDGIARAAADAIVFGESFEESIGKVAQQALADLIAGFVKMGLQMLINYAIAETLGASATASSAAQAGALASAWATPAALASLATSGANAAPAMAGILGTVAMTKALSVATQALKDGGPVVGPGGPRDDKVLVAASNGEFMVNAKATDQWRPFLESINAGQDPFRDMPAYANGGEIDAPVAFRGTPGSEPTTAAKTVAPTSDRRDGGSNVSVPLKIVNVIDPKETLAAMSGSEGERIILNTIERNPSAIRQLLGN